MKKNLIHKDCKISLDSLKESPKTLRNFLSKNSEFDGTVDEHVLLLDSLIRHGCNVFGSYEAFESWIDRANLMLNGKKPSEMLSTVSGFHFIDDRLTGIEFGDNV